MAHAATLGRRQAGDVADHRLRHIGLDPGRGLGLLRAANLADHDHGFGVGVGLETLEVVEEAAAVDRVTADAHAGGHADAQRLHLRGGLVAQRARARDDADIARQVDVAGHDAQHCLAGADDAGAVGADHGGAHFLAVAAQVALDAHHVLGRDAVGDDADELQAGVGRLHQRVGRERRRHEGQAGLGAGRLDGVLHGVEYRPVEVFHAALAGRHATDQVGAVGDHFLGVEGRLVAGVALDDDAGRFVDEDAHGIPWVVITAVTGLKPPTCPALRRRPCWPHRPANRPG